MREGFSADLQERKQEGGLFCKCGQLVEKGTMLRPWRENHPTELKERREDARK